MSETPQDLSHTYLDNDEQGVLNDVGEIKLEVPSARSNIRVVLRPYPDLGGLHGSEHTGSMADPGSPLQLLPDPVS